MKKREKENNSQSGSTMKSTAEEFLKEFINKPRKQRKVTGTSMSQPEIPVAATSMSGPEIPFAYTSQTQPDIPSSRGQTHVSPHMVDVNSFMNEHRQQWIYIWLQKKSRNSMTSQAW